MDKKQSGSSDPTGTMAAHEGASENPLEINQIDFQTMKAASDTTKVRIFFNIFIIFFFFLMF